MPPRNLSAFTAITHPYPPYISINEMEDGRIGFSIRQPPKAGVAGNYAAVTISREVGIELLRDALKKLEPGS